MTTGELTTEPVAEPASAPQKQPKEKSSRMQNLGFRTFSSVILIGVVLATLFWLPLWTFTLVMVIFVSIGLQEFYTMARNRGILVHRPLGVFLGATFTCLVAWRSLVQPGLMPTPLVGEGATVMNWMWDIFWPATIVIIFIRQITRKNTFEALNGAATTLFGLAYIAGLFNYLFYLRTFNATQGAWLVCFLILVTKMGDIGAYSMGNLIGRHPLIARISPKKTVEGFVGAMLFSGATAVFARSMIGTPISPPVALCLGMFLGVCGQLGDLAESLIKRDCRVKDSGVFIPGLGGMLDVIDSLLFTAPVFYGFLIYG